MLIKKEGAKRHDSSDTCSVWEHSHPTESLSFATALIDGRYPQEKRATNLSCEQIYYAISGSGSIHSDKGDFNLNQGDSYYFERGERYWVDGSKLVLAVMNSPKWTPEQYRIVD